MKTIEGLMEIQKEIAQGTSVSDALTRQKIWSSRLSLYQKALKLFTLPDLQTAYATGIEIDRLIKTYQMEQAWQDFEQLLMGIVRK